MTKYEVAIFLLAGCIIGLIIYNVQKSQSKKQMAQRALHLASKKLVSEQKETTIETPVVVIAEPQIEAQVEEVVPKVEEPIKKVKKSMWNDADETPESAFPSMHADLNDKDSELAQAYTYENLQDSIKKMDTIISSL